MTSPESPGPLALPQGPAAAVPLANGSGPSHSEGEWLDAAGAPEKATPPAAESAALRSHLKVAHWQHHNSQVPHAHSNGTSSEPGGAPSGRHPPQIANGNQGVPAVRALPNGADAVESPSSATDTSPPSTHPPSSPSHRSADLRLTDPTRRLASVRTVGLLAAPPSVEGVAGALPECQRALAAAHVREAELQRETRTLAARLAHLRMAHEAQAGKLAEAAARAVSARSALVAENAALSAALAAAAHGPAVYAQQLLPLLVHHGLTPSPADPHAVASSVVLLVDRLTTEINLLQKVVVGGGPVLEQRLTSIVSEAAVLPPAPVLLAAPQASPSRGQDVRGSADSTLSLATGIGPAPPLTPAAPAGRPLFPGGTWSPLLPEAAPSPATSPRFHAEPPSSTGGPPLSVDTSVPPFEEEASPISSGPSPVSGVPVRPASVRFRPGGSFASPSASEGGLGPGGSLAGLAVAEGGRAGVAGSLSRRSPSWRLQEGTSLLRFREGEALGSDISGEEGPPASGSGRGASLRESQRNLLDSITASHSRALAAAPDNSTWQMSSLGVALDGGAGGEDRGDGHHGSQQDQEQDEDPLPAIVNLRIAGEAVLGGKLTACGHSVNGSSLCYFQWVRHKQDGSAYYIQGAKQPEYLVSADDVLCQITVECLPVDDRGRKGELVSAAANSGEPIPLDDVMANLLTGYQASGKAKFTVLDAHNWQEHELVIQRSSFTIKRGSHVVIKEAYSADVAAEIAVNDLSIVLIHISDDRRMDLDAIDNRSRDLAVLTLRHFVEAHLQYLDERSARKRSSFFSRR